MRKWLPLAAICACTFMLLIDVTIVNVALPALARNLQTSFSSLQWVVDSYALVLAALVLASGSLADRIGHRRTFIAGLVVFGAASLACGFASGTGVLIAARAVQGVGGAAMFSTTFPLLNGSYQGRDRGTAYGIWGAVAGASAAVGPVLGGLLTETLSWRWIFFVNPPVAIAVVALCWKLADTHSGTRRVDVPGTAVLTAVAGSFTYGLIRAGEAGWGVPSTWGFLAAGAVLAVAFAGIESRAREPLLDLRLLASRTFSGMMLAGLALNFAAFAYLTYTSIWLQSVLRMTPIQAGLVAVPLSLTAFVVAGMSGRALHNASPGRVVGVGLVLIGFGGLAGTFLRGSWPWLVPGFVVVGVGVGLVSPMLGAATMAAVPRERAGMAGGAVNMMRQLGYAFGVAILGTVFEARAQTSFASRGLPRSLGQSLAGGQAVRFPGLRSAFEAASLSGLRGAFLVAGLAGLVSGLVVLVVVRSRPASPASLESAPREARPAIREAEPTIPEAEPAIREAEPADWQATADRG